MSSRTSSTVVAVDAITGASAARSNSPPAARSTRGRRESRCRTVSGSSSFRWIQPGTALVADPVLIGRIEVHVVDPPALGATPRPLMRCTRTSSGASRSTTPSTRRPPRQARRPAPRLGNGPGKAVEDHARVSPGSRESLLDHRHDEGVGHEIAPVHVGRAASPSSVPSLRASRSTSPVTSPLPTEGLRQEAPCVPFPTPGGPAESRPPVPPTSGGLRSDAATLENAMITCTSVDHGP
jgi:hypothetical protein